MHLYIYIYIYLFIYAYIYIHLHMHIYLHMYVILSECVCVCAEWEKERQALEDDAFYYAPWSSQRGARPPQGLKNMRVASASTPISGDQVLVEMNDTCFFFGFVFVDDI